MINADMLLVNGTIVTDNNMFKGTIAVKDEKIIDVSENEDYSTIFNCDNIIDLSGKYILPGCIDPHVHFQDPGFTEREDFAHGTMAAAAGGITTVISHPLDSPATTSFEALKYKEQQYEEKGYVDYAVHMGATSDNTDIIADMWNKTGVTAIKMFMCYSVAEFPFVNKDKLCEILKIVADNDALAIIHAEDNDILNEAQKEVDLTDKKDGLAYNATHPQKAETEAIKTVISCLKKTGARAVILHVSTADGLILINEAKKEGVKIYAESSPHLFQFTDEDMKEKGPFLKFSPVMHDKNNQERMWNLLSKGYVDYIGSDHSPYTLEEKEAGIENIFLAPNGIPGIETSLAVFLNVVNKGIITLKDVVRMTSKNPAFIYGLAPEKGNIDIGTDADFTVVDLDYEKSISSIDLKSKCKWSPYIGMKLKGWPVMTVVRGNIVYSSGKIVSEKAIGKYVKRKK